PLVVQPVDQLHQFGVILDRRSRSKHVALARQDSDIATQQVCGNVLYAPLRRGSRASPVLFAKTSKQGEQLGSQGSKAVNYDDLSRVFHRPAPAMFLRCVPLFLVGIAFCDADAFSDGTWMAGKWRV